MENDARFDLNGALCAWREQFAAQPAISDEDLRELQNHLLECFEAERRRGHSEREAFTLAVRHIGATDCIGAEYAKVNPLRTWPHRVSLMAFAGLLMWTWSIAVQTLLIGAQVFGHSPAADLTLYIVLGITLDGILPLTVLGLVVKGRAKRLLHGLHFLFGSRWRFLGFVLLCTILLNYAGAWSVWHNPNPEKIFGPGVKEHLTIGALFWQYCKHWPMWPGPFVALLAWLAPCLQRAFSVAASGHISSRSAARDLVYWLCVGFVAIGCFSQLSGATYRLFSTVAFWVYPDSEMPFRILLTALRWTPNALLCTIAIMIVLGKWSTGADKAAPWFRTRTRVALAGILSVVISQGAVALGTSLASSGLGHWLLWLLNSAFWPLASIAFIIWLTPSRTFRARISRLSAGG